MADTSTQAPPIPSIPGTNFAPPYKSTFLTQNPQLAHGLQHVNCSYLTTYDRKYASIPHLAPNLKELKQHAKALLVLIKHLTVAQRGEIINKEGYLEGTVDKETGELKGGGDGGVEAGGCAGGDGCVLVPE